MVRPACVAVRHPGEGEPGWHRCVLWVGAGFATRTLSFRLGGSCTEPRGFQQVAAAFSALAPSPTKQRQWWSICSVKSLQ